MLVIFHHSFLVDPRRVHNFLPQMASFHLITLADLKRALSFLRIVPMKTATSHLITKADPRKSVSYLHIIPADLKRLASFPHTTPRVDPRMVDHSLLITLVEDFQMVIFHQCIMDLRLSISDLNTT